MIALQDKSDYNRLMLEGEELKTLPFGDVWERYCQEQGAPTGKEFLEEINRYETAVTSRR